MHGWSSCLLLHHRSCGVGTVSVYIINGMYLGGRMLYHDQLFVKRSNTLAVKPGQRQRDRKHVCLIPFLPPAQI